MLTVKAAAERACVCESIVRGWCASGQLPHFRLGAKGRRGKIMILPDDLDGLLAAFKVSSPPPKPAAKADTSGFRHLRV